MTPPPRQLSPLVTALNDLTPEQLSRFSRHIILPGFGREAQRRLLSARVAVVGAGGLGSPILLYLAAAGVGTIGIIDDDTVEASNLQRQVIHSVRDVGRSKADSAREAVLTHNPEATVNLHPIRLNAQNALDILGGYDLVLDGSDNFTTRYLASDAAEILNIPCVWGSILRFTGQVTTFWNVPNDGRLGVTYRDLFPEPPAPGTTPSCAEGGVLGVLCATIGSAMATEAVKLITGVGTTLLGRVLHYDALSGKWREFALERDPERVPVTQLEEDEVTCSLPPETAHEPDCAPEPATAGTLPRTHAWTARELAHALQHRESSVDAWQLIDIREPAERDIAVIPGSRHIPLTDFSAGNATQLLPHDAPVVLYCHHGVRSAHLLADLERAGFTQVHHLTGGIESWSRTVDDSVPRY
ncbi:adenylyltransferase/sulfurtransferase MoeZ [Klugiella xanthotipulae]|uniref:Adenylyltransferase/sulfurtransferase n=1 Tax=Klugiella xanthotipulae TaxID=244735 RepID=A0A543HSZ3_9MICO|nr:ThiF family adenylyltransferase [Klugiella xanthotipulae]TQM61455.1 adenylyltransferase/sulfurtransferase [Klugiella xanthotipulae]